MVKAIRIHEYGGPEVMRWEPVEVGAPAAGEVRIKKIIPVGLNYIDVYHRTGTYQVGTLPAVIGMEGAGEVLAVGPGVTEFKPGDRIAYANPIGAYAEERNIPVARLVPLPEAIPYKTAAAMMLQGMTVRYLFKDTFKVGPRPCAVPCRRGRRGPHRLPVGEGAGRDDDRYGLVARRKRRSRRPTAAIT